MFRHTVEVYSWEKVLALLALYVRPSERIHALNSLLYMYIFFFFISFFYIYVNTNVLDIYFMALTSVKII